MSIKETDFLESRFLSSQSDQFKKLSKNSDWLEKSGRPKILLRFLKFKQVINVRKNSGRCIKFMMEF